MKRNLCLLLLCIFAISALAQSRFMEIMAQTYAKPERVYQYYVHHQPDSIYSMGVKTFSAYFTSEQFSSQIRALDERLGQPVEASFWETRRAQGYEVYSRNIIFPRHTATLTVAFDSAGELVGFTLGNEKSRVAHGERLFACTPHVANLFGRQRACARGHSRPWQRTFQHGRVHWTKRSVS